MAAPQSASRCQVARVIVEQKTARPRFRKDREADGCGRLGVTVARASPATSVVTKASTRDAAALRTKLRCVARTTAPPAATAQSAAAFRSQNFGREASSDHPT